MGESSGGVKKTRTGSPTPSRCRSDGPPRARQAASACGHTASAGARKNSAIAKAPKRVAAESEQTTATKKSKRQVVQVKAGEVLKCDPCGAMSSDCVGRL